MIFQISEKQQFLNLFSAFQRFSTTGVVGYFEVTPSFDPAYHFPEVCSVASGLWRHVKSNLAITSKNDAEQPQGNFVGEIVVVHSDVLCYHMVVFGSTLQKKDLKSWFFEKKIPLKKFFFFLKIPFKKFFFCKFLLTRGNCSLIV